MDISYRVAEPNDAEAIALLHARSWRDAYRGILRDEFLDNALESDRIAVWRDRFGSPALGQFVQVATVGETPIGFVCTFGAESERWGSCIDNVHVAPDFRSRGVGRVLMRHAAHWLASRFPSVGVYLWVFEANARARELYQRLGAANVETTIMEYPGGGEGPYCRYAWPTPQALAARA